MSEHTDLYPIAIKSLSSGQRAPGKAPCPSAHAVRPWFPMPSAAPLARGVCYLHVCNAVVTAQRHLQASSQSDAFDGCHHRLLAAFDERHDGGQANSVSLRRGKSSDVSSWGSTKRLGGISGQGGDQNSPSLCTTAQPLTDTQVLAEHAAGRRVVNRNRPLLGPPSRNPGSLILFTELWGRLNTKMQRNCKDCAVIAEICRHSWCNIEPGIVKCKLLLTSDVELHRNCLAFQASSTGEDLLFTTAPAQVHSIC